MIVNLAPTTVTKLISSLLTFLRQWHHKIYLNVCSNILLFISAFCTKHREYVHCLRAKLMMTVEFRSFLAIKV